MASYLGSYGGAEINAFTNTLSWTTTMDIPERAHVVICSGYQQGGGILSSITVGSLSLSADYHTAAGGSLWLDWWSARATSLISTGATVTVTYSASLSEKAAVGEVLWDIAPSSEIRSTSLFSAGGFDTQSATGAVFAKVGDVALAFTDTDSGVDISSVSNGYTLGGFDGTNAWGQDLGFSERAAYKVITVEGQDAGAVFNLGAGATPGAGIVVYSAMPGITRPRGMPRKVNDEAPLLYRPWIRA